MPRIKLRRRKPQKKRLVLLTDKVIYERAMRTVRQLDQMIEQRKAKQATYLDHDLTKGGTVIKAVRKGKLDPEAIHKITAGGVCYRPDKWYAAGRACDQCLLYPYCLREGKRLKDKDSQPADQNPTYLKKKRESEKVYGTILNTRKRRVRVVSGPKPKRIRIRKNGY